MADFLDKLAVNTGTVPNPYRQFTVSIPAGGRKRIDYDFNVVAILGTSQNSLSVNFAGYGGDTVMTERMEYRSPIAIPYIELINTDAVNSLTVDFALANGEIDDFRFAPQGPIEVVTSSALEVYEDETLTHLSTTTLTLDANGEATIPANTNATHTIVQNTGTHDIRLFTATGLVVAPLGTFDLTVKTSYTVYGTVGDTVVVSAFKRG